MACVRVLLLEMGALVETRAARGLRMEVVLTAATTRRKDGDEEAERLLAPLLPLQLAPAALEARQAAVAIERGGRGGKREREEVGEGKRKSELFSFFFRFD